MKVIYQPKGRAGEYAKYAVNLYNGCLHGCKYCYVPKFTQKSSFDFHKNAEPRNSLLINLEKDCLELRGKIKDNVLLCFLTDPYPPIDNKFTRKALEIFRKYDIPFTILTKGGKRAIRDFDLYSKQDHFASTLTFVSNEKTKKWEPKAELFNSRFEAIKEAKKRGIFTWVSLEPIIDPLETFKIIELTYPYVDLYKIGKVNYINLAINWHDLVLKIINMLNKLNKNFYIKKDLRQYIY